MLDVVFVIMDILINREVYYFYRVGIFVGEDDNCIY